MYFSSGKLRQHIGGKRRFVGEDGGGPASAGNDLGGGRTVVDDDLA